MPKSFVLLVSLFVLTACGFSYGGDFLVSQERTFDFFYDVRISAIPDDAQRIAVWVPVPQSKVAQRVESIHVEGLPSHDFVMDERYGNRFVYAEIERSAIRDGEASFSLVMRIHRATMRALVEGGPSPQGISQDDLEAFLKPSKLVRSDGSVAAEAQRVAGKGKGPLEQAKLLYDHIVSTVRYDKSGRGWGRGDSAFACDVRAGNCTDFHSLFMGEARSLGIPARFIMGFGLPGGVNAGEVGGYHCWAEFYLKDWGWVPVDASEAFKHPERRDFLFGNLDADRVEFTTGRDIEVPKVKNGPLNFAIYPYVEIDGKIHGEVARTFRFADVN